MLNKKNEKQEMKKNTEKYGKFKNIKFFNYLDNINIIKLKIIKKSLKNKQK